MVRKLLLLSLASTCGLARAQSADDVVRETQRLKTQYEEERKGASADSARQAQWRAQSRERLSAMRADGRRLSRERDSLRTALEQEGKPKPPPPPPVAPATARKKALSLALAREIDRTLPLLAGETRDMQEVRRRWTSLSKGLRANTEDPEGAMGQFLDDLSERVDAGGRITARPGSWTDSTGRVLRGIWIELGSGTRIFSAPGSTAIGTGEGPAKSVSDPALVQAVSRSAKILSGEAAPGWVSLPVTGGAK